eukprot:12730265-Heterocapsa_arctica.AAC.1
MIGPFGPCSVLPFCRLLFRWVTNRVTPALPFGGACGSKGFASGSSAAGPAWFEVPPRRLASPGPCPALSRPQKGPQGLGPSC